MKLSFTTRRPVTTASSNDSLKSMPAIPAGSAVDKTTLLTTKPKLSFSFGPKKPAQPAVAPQPPLARPDQPIDPKPSNPAQRPKQEQKADVPAPVKVCPKAERPPTRADLMAAKIMPMLSKLVSKVPEHGGVFTAEFKGPIYDELMAMEGGMSDRNRTFCIAICNLHPCGLNFEFTEYCTQKKITAGFQILSKPMKPVSFRKS